MPTKTKSSPTTAELEVFIFGLVCFQEGSGLASSLESGLDVGLGFIYYKEFNPSDIAVVRVVDAEGKS